MIPIPQNARLTGAEILGAVLVLHWRDGHRGEVPLAALRAHCPCAVCQGSRRAEAKNPLRMAARAPQPAVQEAHPVGRYALQFVWADGHATGIYSFDLLRGLCECPECHPAG